MKVHPVGVYDWIELSKVDLRRLLIGEVICAASFMISLKHSDQRDQQLFAGEPQGLSVQKEHK
jgi:hypothetical protein